MCIVWCNPKGNWLCIYILLMESFNSILVFNRYSMIILNSVFLSIIWTSRLEGDLIKWQSWNTISVISVRESEPLLLPIPEKLVKNGYMFSLTVIYRNKFHTPISIGIFRDTIHNPSTDCQHFRNFHNSHNTILLPIPQ